MSSRVCHGETSAAEPRSESSASRGRVRVDFLPTRLDFGEKAETSEGLQVNGGGLALGDAGDDQIGDPAVGIDENDLGELTGVDFRQVPPDLVGRSVEQVPDRPDFGRRPSGSFAYGGEHEQNPRLPGAVRGDGEQSVVVRLFVVDDIAAQIEGRYVEKALFDEEQQVEHPPRSAVAIGERMNCLELVVHDGEPDQRIDAVVRVDIVLPIGELVAEQLGAFGWSIDAAAGRLVHERRARGRADIEVHPLDGPADFDGEFGPKSAGFSRLLKPSWSAVR